MADAAQQLRNFALGVDLSAVNAVSLSSHMTLRNACIDYRDNGGACWVDSTLPEASAAMSQDQIPCLNRFRNAMGHVIDSQIICFPIHKYNSLLDLCGSLKFHLNDAFTSGRLWSIPGTVPYRFTGCAGGGWVQGDRVADQYEVDILSKVKLCTSPLSASTTHAAMECEYFITVNECKAMYMYPHNAAISTGIIGSLHDNQCIDMSPGEEKKKFNMDNRSYQPEFIGFICTGHTSHSQEAGRVRRVACDTRVRILSVESVIALQNIADEVFMQCTESVFEDKDWTVFCMGLSCNISEREVRALCRVYAMCCLQEPQKFSLHLNAGVKLVVISISSGTLIKRCSNGYWADNVEVHMSSRLTGILYPRINTTGSDQIRACFSAFFALIPYVSSNRAPRPLIASVQTPQAVCLPWCPATAAVSPCYTFDPVVTTPLYSAVMEDIRSGSTNISCYLPGENVQCLFLNLMYTYEDAIIVSKKYVDMGGFSTISMCSYNISRSEYIPPVGSTMCGILSQWWKSPCQKNCTHKIEDMSRRKYIVGYKPTGVVHSITPMNDGDINVRIRSHQQLQDGDKLSMGHGQKGIAVIMPYEDMPIAYSKKHGQIVPDIVMGMSSVITRQTNGVLYEAAKSLSLFHSKSNLPFVSSCGDRSDVSDEFIVVSGLTGATYKTMFHNNRGDEWIADTRATLGIVRVFSQTQMSRERHQVSHLRVTRNTLVTQSGRARGGGVAWGEMEVQSASSAGLNSCVAEIIGNGNNNVVLRCTMCQRLDLLCTCTTPQKKDEIIVSYDEIVTDCISAIVYNGSFQYATSEEELR